VTILTAASATTAIQEIVGSFSATNPEWTVHVSGGPSHGLARQILSGAPADLFLSANETWMREVQAAGLVDQQVPLLGNRLVIIVPKGNPSAVRTVGDLLSPRVQRVALAGENVPAGMYAEQFLRSRNVYDSLLRAGKVVRGSDVRAALVFVERAEVDAGIVYATDAAESNRVEVVEAVDPASHDPVVYPLALLKRPAPSRGGQQLYAYLQSEQAAGVFQRHGFQPGRNSETKGDR
jgi:molybdate transport system substrate-binding protein